MIYKLSSQEEYALSVSLDQDIPDKFNKNKIQTEFENVHYHVLQHTKDLDQGSQDELKSKITRKCEKNQKSRYHIKNKKLSTIYQTTKVLFLLNRT